MYHMCCIIWAINISVKSTVNTEISNRLTRTDGGNRNPKAPKRSWLASKAAIVIGKEHRLTIHATLNDVLRNIG